MVVPELYFQGSLQHRYRHCQAAMSITSSPTPDFPAQDSGPNMDVTIMARTVSSETRCSTTPTPPEDVPQEAAHPPLTVCSKRHGAADPAQHVTLRTPRHGLTPVKLTAGPYPTDSYLSATHQDATASAPTAASRVSTRRHLTWQSAQAART